MKTAREVLLVDDNPADLDLTSDVLRRNFSHSNIHSVMDGIKALAFLRRQGEFANAARPDVVLLDLSLPGKSGLEVLKEIKSDEALQTIPVVIFSTSKAAQDISRSYRSGANCYINKPGNLQDFDTSMTSFAQFWLCCALLHERQN